MRLVLRVLHGLMAALFIWAAALQYNDVDILRWVAIYLAAATVCVFAVLNRPKPVLAAIVGLISLAWSVLYLIHGEWRVPIPALFSSWEMKDQTIVAGREMDGLLIIFGWMLLAWATSRKSATAK